MIKLVRWARHLSPQEQYCTSMTRRIIYWWTFLDPSHPLVTALFDFFVDWVFKSAIRFSTLHEEASNNHPDISQPGLCKKAMVLDEKFKRTGHSVALIKVILLLLLLQQCLSDDACFRIHIVPSTTTLRDWLTHTSSKKAKPVGSLYASQGTVLLGSRTPILSEDRDGASVVVGLNQGLHKASWAGRWSGSRAVRCQIKDLAWSQSDTGF